MHNLKRMACLLVVLQLASAAAARAQMTIEIKGKKPMTTYVLIGRQDARSAEPNGD